jgi:hypothetical protein
MSNLDSGNVVDMFENSIAFRDNGYGPADFELGQAPLVYWTEDMVRDYNMGYLSSSKHVIYRTDTAAELGVHGSRYSDLYDLSYKRMIDNQRACIERSDLNITDIKENIQVSHNGAMCFVTHRLPAESLRTPGNDHADLTLLSVSSLNGVWPFICSVGANQWACMNGQVFTSDAAMLYKARHTKKLDIDHASRVMGRALNTFKAEVDIWHYWATQSVTDFQAFLVFAEAANATGVFKHLKEDPYIGISGLMLKPTIASNKNLSYLCERWFTHYKRSLGSNEWAVYNTLTDWSTHAPAATKKSVSNIASISHKRGEIVRATVMNNFKLAA